MVQNRPTKQKIIIVLLDIHVTEKIIFTLFSPRIYQIIHINPVFAWFDWGKAFVLYKEALLYESVWNI